MPKIVFIYVKDGGPGGGRGKWCSYTAFGASKARTSGSNCQGRRTAAAAVSIHMNFEGSCENFLQSAPPPSDGGARSSKGCAAAASFNLLTPQSREIMLFIGKPMGRSIMISNSIMGLTFVGAAGAAAQSVVNTAAAGAARGGRNAEAQCKGKHSDDAFRLDPGHCHHLSNPNVLIAYNKWATNQNTAKKAPYWAFYDELKAAVGKYPPVWRCAGCHPVAEAALDL